MRTTPFFNRKAGDSALYDETTGSAYAASTMVRNRLLAQAIPARTLPAGANYLKALPPDNNKDMQTEYTNEWPIKRTEDNWRHGDVKEVAYPFVYKLFDAILDFGGFK